MPDEQLGMSLAATKVWKKPTVKEKYFQNFSFRIEQRLLNLHRLTFFLFDSQHNHRHSGLSDAGMAMISLPPPFSPSNLISAF